MILRPVAPDVRETTEIGRYLTWLAERGLHSSTTTPRCTAGR